MEKFPGEPNRIPVTLAFTPVEAAMTLAEHYGGCTMTTGTTVGKLFDLAGVNGSTWRAGSGLAS